MTAASKLPLRDSTRGAPAALAQDLPVAPLKLLTWNVLAPVYFRQNRGHGVEAVQPEAYITRNDKICAAIAESKADVVCLQEHWFSPSLVKLYNDRLKALGFRYEALQRTAWNCDGRSEDGIAIFVREASLRVVDRHEVRFHDYGIPQDRVALLLTLQDNKPGAGLGQRFAIMCTHLTYPHSPFDVESRNRQIAACMEAAHAHLPEGMPVVIAGDLNGPTTDRVANHLKGLGFCSAWDQLHGRACAITHTDHRGNSFASDHVWFRGPFNARRAVLLPEGVPDDRPLHRPTVGSIARRASALESSPVQALSYEDWCELSDHRPLVVELSWGS